MKSSNDESLNTLLEDDKEGDEVADNEGEWNEVGLNEWEDWIIVRDEVTGEEVDDLLNDFSSDIWYNKQTENSRKIQISNRLETKLCKESPTETILRLKYLLPLLSLIVQ